MNKNVKKHYLKIAGAIILVAIIIGGMFHILGNRNATADETISGTVNFNGIKPEEGDDKIATLKLMYKDHGSNEEFMDTRVEVPLYDGANWSWNEAEKGKTYDLRIDLYINDRFIKSSDVVTATAPSDDLVLDMNVSIEDIPEAVIKDITTTISGTFNIQGYIPEGSTITLLQKIKGGSDYVVAEDNIPAKNNSTFSWDLARNGREYSIKGQLISGGTVIGESVVYNITSPAKDEVITIKSTAQAPVESATISGVINLNGPVDQNSTILLLQREPGQANFTPINRFPAISGTPFTWSDAVSGQTYEITAALQVNDQNVSSGNTLTVTAPASNQTIVIDTNLSLDPPTSAPSYSCGPADSTGSFNAKVTFPTIKGAQKFNIQIGSTSTNASLINNTVTVNSGSDFTQSVYIPGNTDTFARYSYTFCSDCDTSNSQNWSAYSPTLGFKCTQ